MSAEQQRCCGDHDNTYTRASWWVPEKCSTCKFADREWPRYCRKVYWTKMVQNGPDDHFGQNGLILNWILAFARPKWSILVHSGLKRSILVHLGPPTVLRPFLSRTLKGSSNEWTLIIDSIEENYSEHGVLPSSLLLRVCGPELHIFREQAFSAWQVLG